MKMPEDKNKPINPFEVANNATNTGGLDFLKTVASNSNSNENSIVQTLLNKNKKKKRTSIAMTQNSYDKIVTLAMVNDISVSAVVEMIIEEAVKDVQIKEHLVKEFNKKEKARKEKIRKKREENKGLSQDDTE